MGGRRTAARDRRRWPAAVRHRGAGRRNSSRHAPGRTTILDAVTAEPLSDPRLAKLRRAADRFMAALDEEHYLHYAGLKPTLDLQPIY